MTMPPTSAVDLAERARRGLSGTRWRLDWVDDTGSTNADLLAAAADGEPAGAVLAAEHQGAGRGRLDRRWEAEPGSSLLVSILLRPQIPLAAAHLVAVATALAAARACEDTAGVRPGLKWPNDLVIGEGAGTRKLGGILAESQVLEGEVRAVVVGLGLNVTLPERLPAELAGVATSLSAHAAGADIDRPDLLADLLRHLDALVDLLDTPAGRTRLLDEYRRRCVTLGSTVRVEVGPGHGTAGEAGAIEGEAVAIDDDGHLVVRAGDVDHVVTVGDVVHLRPAASS